MTGIEWVFFITFSRVSGLSFALRRAGPDPLPGFPLRLVLTVSRWLQMFQRDTFTAHRLSAARQAPCHVQHIWLKLCGVPRCHKVASELVCLHPGAGTLLVDVKIHLGRICG